MVNKPLIRPYFSGGVSFGGVARIPLKNVSCHPGGDEESASWPRGRLEVYLIFHQP